MTSPTPRMIVSGVPYAVTGLEGQDPSQLAEFTGQVTMQAEGLTGRHEISGSCEQEHDGAVRLHEKDHHGTGKDVRVWTVSPATDEDGFVAAG